MFTNFSRECIEGITYLAIGVKSGALRKYSLNQAIRGVNIPDDRFLTSKEFIEIWNRLSTEDHLKYRDEKEFTINNLPENKYFRTCKVNSKQKVDTLLKNKMKIKFTTLFIDEHIVPVGIIVNKILNLEEITYDKVEEIINNNLYLARITKIENTLIPSNKERELSLVKNIELYKKLNIELTNI